MPSAATLEALVTLLDDPDADVQSAVQDELATYGPNELDALRAHIRTLPAPKKERLYKRLRPLHFRMVKRAWHAIMGSPNPDLEQGAFVLAWYRYPDLDIPAQQELLDDMARSFRERHPHVTGVDAALKLAEYMVYDLHFTGNRDDYQDPNNSFLNRVLKRRTGIPISLSVVYILLGNRLDLRLYGVNMPKHFVAKYMTNDEELFIDMFNDGQPMSRTDCIRFLLRADVQPLQGYFDAATPTDVLLRMVRNLLVWAHRTDNAAVGEELKQLAAPWDPSIDVNDASGYDG